MNKSIRAGQGPKLNKNKSLPSNMLMSLKRKKSDLNEPFKI